MEYPMNFERVAVGRGNPSSGEENNLHHKTPLVRRTQSYDAASGERDLLLAGGEADNDDELLEYSPSPLLHTSFDVSQLSTYARRNEGSQHNGRSSRNAEGDNISALSSSELLPPPPNNFHLHASTAKTPVRTRLPRATSSASKAVKASGKHTPARHRFTRRLSPAQQQRVLSRSKTETISNISGGGQHSQSPSSSSSSSSNLQLPLAPPTTQKKQPTQSSASPSSPFLWNQTKQKMMDTSSSLLPETTAMESPTSPTSGTPPTHKKFPKLSLGSITTVANSTILETTTETDDSTDQQQIISNPQQGAATETTTAFGFSAFPSSLPRILPAAQNHNNSLGTARQPVHEKDKIFYNPQLPPHPPSAERHTSHHNQRQQDLDEEMSTSPIGTPVGRRRLNFNSAMTPTGGQQPMFPSPGTPKDVKLHFLQSGQCSPIRGIPEEDGDVTSSTLSEKRKNDSSLHSSGGSSSRAGGGSRRPMPDMNAFEGDVSHDNSGASSSSRSHPPSPRLLCPPTPVRTPAWVHAPAAADASVNAPPSTGSRYHHHHHKHGKFGRQNSLIATKVLATCSQRDLDGRTSLENSLLLEDDSFKQQSHSQLAHETSANSSSILTFAESAGAATEPETDHASSIRDDEEESSCQFPPDPSEHQPFGHVDDDDEEEENEDGWLHDSRRSHSRLFDNDEQREHEALSTISNNNQNNEVVSFSTTFDILGVLGKGTFADVFKVRSKKDGKLYAVKKHRRQFRGRRDREMTLAEARTMQRLQSANANNQNTARSSYCLYLLFFYQAWQEEGHFFCQTELCCRDTCREFIDALRLNWVATRNRYSCLKRLPAPLGIVAGSDQDIIGRLVPEATIWKICHDTSAGLSHIHSHGLVHYDIKPSNIFLAAHPHFGAMCKIGDFGMAGDINTTEDGQEGDQKYMPPELLSSSVKHPSADMFSLGLTLYELASSLSFEVPSEGQLWHDLRSAKSNNFPSSRDPSLVGLIQSLIVPSPQQRPTADGVLSSPKVQLSTTQKDEFLLEYIQNVEQQELEDSQQTTESKTDDQTPRVLGGRARLCISPSLAIPPAPTLFSSPKQAPPPFA